MNVGNAACRIIFKQPKKENAEEIDMDKEIEMLTLLLRHLKGVISALEKYLEYKKERIANGKT